MVGRSIVRDVEESSVSGAESSSPVNEDVEVEVPVVVSFSGNDNPFWLSVIVSKVNVF